METPEQILKRLELKVVRKLDGFLFGDYTGVFYGPSLDLAEVREYTPGDEIRRIDWNVTARTNKIHVRQYREEKELTAWLVLDLSPSMAFGTRRLLKRQLAAEFAAAAAYIITRHGDKVGAMFFPDPVLIPPRAGKIQALHMLHAIERMPAAHGRTRTNLAEAILNVDRTVRRRSLFFLISDFLSPDGWDIALRRLGQRHDVIAVRVTDPIEGELPDVGMLTFEDPETGEQVRLDTSDARVRAAYRTQARTHEERMQAAFRRSATDVLTLSTHQPLVEPLLRFLAYRKRRRTWNSPGR
ncbi:MAG: DUF58 domain-containing protein [Armatimonadetes bacterium]|nr:DUF58 domain-containing protein [Armatimonadota bacterium]